MKNALIGGKAQAFANTYVAHVKVVRPMGCGKGSNLGLWAVTYTYTHIFGGPVQGFSFLRHVGFRVLRRTFFGNLWPPAKLAFSSGNLALSPQFLAFLFRVAFFPIQGFFLLL